MADITPAHKKDNKTDKRNYRPVSILPSISKIFERIIYEDILQYYGKHIFTLHCVVFAKVILHNTA